jgi:hypothetical protein
MPPLPVVTHVGVDELLAALAGECRGRAIKAAAANSAIRFIVSLQLALWLRSHMPHLQVGYVFDRANVT